MRLSKEDEETTKKFLFECWLRWLTIAKELQDDDEIPQNQEEQG